MGNLFNKSFDTELPLSKKLTVRAADAFIFVLITALAFYARVSLFEFTSGDYNGFLLPWYDTLKEAGGIRGIGLSIGDYTPPYIYLMALMTYLPFKALFSIKIFSVVFDFVLAVYAMKLVYFKWRNNVVAITAYGIALFLPTILFNSAFWAQCDAIFTSFLLISLYYFLKDRPVAGMICFSIAFSLKLQAVFLAPLLLLLFLNGKVRLRHFLAIPAVYFVGILPALIAGRPISELLTVYFSQAGQYQKLSLNAPSLYIWIAEDTTKAISVAAILLCGAAILLSLYLLYRNRVELTGEVVILAALFFAILVPYLLPHMHERYFYIADILSLVYAFYRPRRFYLPIIVGCASFAGYLKFLFAHEPIPLELASGMMAFSLILVSYDLFHPIWEKWSTKLQQ